MNKLNLNFKGVKEAFGIELDLHDYHKITERFEILIEKAPAISVPHLNFEKVNGMISGVLTIRSMSLDFRSEYTDTDVMTVYNYLEIDILDQLNEWKKVRFHVKPEQHIVA